MRKIIAASVIPFMFLILIFLPGCSQNTDSQVLARVNKVQITSGDLKREIDQLPLHSRAMLMSAQAQERLLQEMVKMELLKQEAERRKLDSQPEIKARLEASRKSILLNALLTQEIRDKVKITDEEIRTYFDKHRDELETSEIHLKQILLRDPKEAEEVRTRLINKESFEDLARQFSADKISGSRGGDLGFVSRGQMPPELERVAFSLKIQEISPIIRSPKGHHIFKLVERKKTVFLKYEEVKDRLKPFAEADKQRDHLDSWLNDLRDGAKVKVYEARLPIPMQTQPQLPKEPSGLAPGKVPALPQPSQPSPGK